MLNIFNKLNFLTKGPVASKHVGEVGDDVEGGVDDVGHREVDDEVVCHRAHSSVGHHNPYDWGVLFEYDDKLCKLSA